MADVPAPAPSPDATGTAPVAPTAPNAWDKFVSAVAKPWAVLGARQQTEAEKGRKNGSLAAILVNPLGANRHPVPDMARPGSLGATDYSNRPTIQILSDTDATAHTTAPVFSDWILHSITGGDAEKAEVVETFGIPHVFTSGRFMRRYTFAGSLRTTLTGARTSGGSRSATSRPTVSHYAAFLRFYDDYLRITKQAETGRFTRVTVDGETFDGWVLSMTPGRDSGAEGFASFTFTMVVRDRNHPGQATALSRYLRRFAGAPRVARPKARAVLNAEIVAATGANKVTVAPTGAAPKVTALGFYPVASVTLDAPGILLVTGSMPGAKFTLSDGKYDVVLQKDQPTTVGLTVNDLAKFVGGSGTIKLIAGVTTESVEFTAENAQPKVAPGTILGSVRASSPPISFPDITRLQAVPLNAVSNGVLTLGLEFQRDVNIDSMPTLTGTEGVTATVTAASARSAAVAVTLPEGVVSALQNNEVPERAFTFHSSGGTFDLPSFTLRVLSASGAITPRRAVESVAATLSYTETTTWELTLTVRLAALYGNIDDVLAMHSLVISSHGSTVADDLPAFARAVGTASTFEASPPGARRRQTQAGVTLPFGRGQGTLNLSGVTGEYSAKVRTFSPVVDGWTITIRAVLFFFSGEAPSAAAIRVAVAAKAPYVAPREPAIAAVGVSIGSVWRDTTNLLD